MSLAKKKFLREKWLRFNRKSIFLAAVAIFVYLQRFLASIAFILAIAAANY